MITISKIQDGATVDYAFLTEQQWEAINYIDYVDMNEIDEMYEVHGEKLVDKALSFFVEMEECY